MSAVAPVPAQIKWGKERLSIELTPGMPASELKRKIFGLTNVPLERQKILAPGVWKGSLKDDATLDETLALKPGQKEISLMLMGTADVVPSGPVEPVVFAEDLSPEDVAAADAAASAEAASKAEGMIPVLQMEPGPERSESKALSSNMPIKYNYFVHGFPQQQVEDTVRQQRGNGGRLLGVCAMTLGQEVGKAYVNSVACLADGATLASGHDNGRIQLWRHARRLCELAHDDPMLAMLGGAPEPITCLVALPTSSGSSTTGSSAGGAAAAHALAFASGAAGSIKLWKEDDFECAASLPTPPGTAPVSMTALQTCHLALGVTLRQARPFDAHAFRLVPQDDAERRRRAEAMAAQEAQRALFAQLARSITVVELAAANGAAAAAAPQQPNVQQLAPGGAFITALASVEHTPLLSADGAGSLQLWTHSGAADQRGAWQAHGRLQLSVGGGGAPSVVCMEPLQSVGNGGESDGGVLAISLALSASAGGEGGGGEGAAAAAALADAMVDVADGVEGDGVEGGGVLHINIPAFAAAHGVALLDLPRRLVLATLDGHTDLVHCMRALPDGSLATAGGKHDGKIRVWAQSQWAPSLSSAASTGDGDGGGAAISGEGSMAPSDAIADSAPLSPVVVREAAKTLREPGYSFDMAVLPDAQAGSKAFALACARYNVVKICL